MLSPTWYLVQFNPEAQHQRSGLIYLGIFSASSSTVSMFSRASTVAAYDPPGPPPMTSTVLFSGTDMLMTYRVNLRDHGKNSELYAFGAITGRKKHTL